MNWTLLYLVYIIILIYIKWMCEWNCVWKKWMKGEEAPRCHLKKNRRLCTQLFEIKRLWLSIYCYNCYSSKVVYLADLTRATDVVVGLVKDASSNFWFGTIPLKLLPNNILQSYAVGFIYMLKSTLTSSVRISKMTSWHS